MQNYIKLFIYPHINAIGEKEYSIPNGAIYTGVARDYGSDVLTFLVPKIEV